MYDAYRQECRSGRLQPGGIFVWQAPDRLIVNLATQRGVGRGAARLAWVRQAARATAQLPVVLVAATVAGLRHLGSQHVTIHIEDPFKRILGVPDLLTLVLIMPIGYPAVEPKTGVRRPLADMVHYDRCEMSKYMTNEQAVHYLYDLRRQTIPQYRTSYVGEAEPKVDSR